MIMCPSCKEGTLEAVNPLDNDINVWVKPVELMGKCNGCKGVFFPKDSRLEYGADENDKPFGRIIYDKRKYEKIG